MSPGLKLESRFFATLELELSGFGIGLEMPGLGRGLASMGLNYNYALLKIN